MKSIHSRGFNARTGILEIRNKQGFATLAWIRGEWELKVSGKRIANGKLPALKTAPQKEEKINLRCLPLPWNPARKYSRQSHP